jgi:glycosyltransferase involved in cell wall biosynthesis
LPSRPRISVVVPARDAEPFLLDVLAALESQTVSRSQFEVVVVDDGSRDGTPSLLAAWSAAEPARRQVVHGSGGGPARARNLGVLHARGEWVAFTDADVLPDPGWLEAVLAAGDGADAVEGRVEPWPPEAAGPYTHEVVNRSGGLYMTANMTYRRELLERVGGFDERFSEPFLEDSDLAFRALDAGAKIRFAPDASVRHRVVPGGPRLVLRSAARLRWLALLAAKHPRRYRDQLSPVLRPLNGADLHVLAGLAGAAGALRVGGLPRVGLALLAVHGVARGLVAHDAVGAPPSEIPSRMLLAVAIPPLKAAWWLAGCIRYRKVAW